MQAQIIDGNRIAAQIKEELRERLTKLHFAGHSPGLAVILVGEDPASKVYVSMKARECRELGIFSKQIDLPETVSEEELLKKEHTIKVAQLYRTDIEVVTPETRVVEVAAKMILRDLRRVFVVENDHLVGIVLRKDIVNMVIRG